MKDDPRYPKVLVERLNVEAPQFIDVIGNPNILQNNKVALFSSQCCPAELIIKAQDLAYKLRNENRTVILGGHSPVEKECLRVLLNGTQPIIICPARSIEKLRIPKAWRKHIEKGRLQILSPFKNLHRMTAKLAWARNLYIAEQADEIIILHAEPNSKTMKLAETILHWGKLMYTIDDPANEPLLRMGLKPLELDKVNEVSDV